MLRYEKIFKNNDNVNKIRQSSPRLFGKLSLLAGLGLPDIINKGDNYEATDDKRISVTLNNPSSKLSPYIAAIYEPFPHLYENPLGYLASLNPFKWILNCLNQTNLVDRENSENNDDVLIVVNNDIQDQDDMDLVNRENLDFQKSLKDKVIKSYSNFFV